MHARERPSDSSRVNAQLQRLRGRFVALLRESNRRGAQRLLRDAEDAGLNPRQLLLEVVVAAFEEISLTWVEAEISLSQIYVAGRIAEDSVDVLLPASYDERPYVGKVVIGTAQGDYHGLGRRIVAAFLRGAVFEVIDQGLSVSPEALVDSALKEKADIIAVSALMADTALAVKKVREEMKRRGAEGISLLVGGAPFRFNPRLVALVGADATGANAYEAIAAAKQLMEGKRGGQ
ncbi:MAG: cobalamin-dependent protein [Chloroflexi bacterium]|nr:cobalamin-dependent protein [Chloroflexota bacterium]MDA8188747.1 cobalamin-dependent protein [Dehalococcoidales bacterium]